MHDGPFRSKFNRSSQSSANAEKKRGLIWSSSNTGFGRKITTPKISMRQQIHQRGRFGMCGYYKRGRPYLINVAVRSCRPILHAAVGCCRNSCLRKLGSLRIGYFGALGLLLGGLQLRLDHLHRCQFGYHASHGLAAAGEQDNLHIQLAGIVGGKC
jgi:hypothetical protein